MLKCTVILWDVPLDSASVGNIMTPESADTDTFNLEYLIIFFFRFRPKNLSHRLAGTSKQKWSSPMSRIIPSIRWRLRTCFSNAAE